MVIGSGIIANSFLEKFKYRNDICIFASGVSSSMCVNEKDFQREKNLILDSQRSIPQDCLFIYFSTCSVMRPICDHSPYIKHKINMESVVNNFSPSLVVRLPQVSGFNGNSENLLNFIIISAKTVLKTGIPNLFPNGEGIT